MPAIDIPGFGTVQADNFASEQTLNRLVEAVNNQTTGAGGIQSIFAAVAGDSKRAAADLKRMGSAASTNSRVTDEASQSVAGLGKSSRGVMAAFSSYATSLSNVNIEAPAGALKGAFDKAGAMVGDGGTALGIAIGATGNVAVAAITAFTSKLVEFGIAGLGVAMGDIDKMGTAYRKAANNGALFGQSMLNFRTFAHTSGLTMEQFGNVLEKNREQVSVFGMATTEGANQFSLANSRVIRDYGDSFQRMGMTFEDIGNNTAEYLAAIAEGTPGVYNTAVSMADVTKGAYNLAVQQKALAAINGTTIEQEKEKMRMQRKDAQMNAVLLGMSQKEREAVQALSAQFPQATQFIKEFVAFGGPVTKEGNMQAAMMGTLTTEIGNTITAVKGGQDLKASLETLKNVAGSSGAIIAETEAMADLVKLGVAGSTNSFVQMAEKNFQSQFELMNKVNAGVVNNVLAELNVTAGGAIGDFKKAIDPAAEAANQLTRAFQEGFTSISSLLDAFYRSETGRNVLNTVANTVTVPAQALQAAAVKYGTGTEAAGTAGPNITAASRGRLEQTDEGLVSSAFAKIPGGEVLEKALSGMTVELTGMGAVAKRQLAETQDLVAEVKALKEVNKRLVGITKENGTH